MMTQLIRCPHCGKPALSIVSIKTEEEHAARIQKAEEEAAAFAIKIDEICWSVRVSHALQHTPIRTLGELCALYEGELLRLPNFGRVSLGEVKDVLKEHGLRLGMRSETASMATEREASDVVEYGNPVFL